MIFRTKLKMYLKLKREIQSVIKKCMIFCIIEKSGAVLHFALQGLNREIDYFLNEIETLVEHQK